MSDVRRFRKKPVIVRAYQTEVEVVIHTLEGDMVASPGDWIITGVKAERYPCKPDIFEATYEPVGDDAQNQRDIVEQLQDRIEELEETLRLVRAAHFAVEGAMLLSRRKESDDD